MNILFDFMHVYVHYVCIWCTKRSVEGMRSPGAAISSPFICFFFFFQLAELLRFIKAAADKLVEEPKPPTAEHRPEVILLEVVLFCCDSTRGSTLKHARQRLPH